MIKLIVGKKGSGKTKILLDMVNAAAKETSGNVVCVEKDVYKRQAWVRTSKNAADCTIVTLQFPEIVCQRHSNCSDIVSSQRFKCLLG